MSPRQKKSTGGARLQKEGTSRSGGQRKSSGWSRLSTQQKVLRVAFLVTTIIAAIIVAAFVIINLVGAPPDVSNRLPDRPPMATTIINEQGEEVEVEIPGLSSERKKQFYTFLLIGQDTFGGGNTDTMMLAAYDVPNQTLNVMSLPRDTFVEYGNRRVLLNSVYNRAGGGEKGINALKQEVGELTGVFPDYYVIVQWEAVGELVDAIGGVEFEVPFNMYYNDLSQDFKIDLKKGVQVLDGKGAMGLLRWRHNSIGDTGKIDNSYGYAEGDIGRIRTQQDFLKATLSKCLQPTVLLPNLTGYINIFLENVETDMPFPHLVYFAKSAVGNLDMDNVSFITMPYRPAGDGAHVIPIGSELVEAVNNGFNPYLEDVRLGELKLYSATVSRPTSKPSQNYSTPEPVDTREPLPSDSPEPGETDAPETDSPESSSTPSVPQGPGSTPVGGEETPVPSNGPTEEPTGNPQPDPTPVAPPPTAPPVEPDPVVPVVPDQPSSGGDVYGPGMEPTD